MSTASPLVAQLVEDAEDPGAHGDVEHGHRLVRDEELRPEDEARGDRDPLSLAAGELVREPLREQLRRREAHLLERTDDGLAPLGARSDPVDDERLGDRRRRRGSADRATRTDPGR